MPNHPWSLAKRRLLASGWSWNCGKPDRFVRDVQEATRPMLDQQMADLPLDRSEVGLPFTNVGIDVFEPWAVQTRRTIGGAAKLKALGSSIPVHGQ